LAAAGISGPDVGRLIEQGWFDASAGRVTLDEVSIPKRGQAMAFVMDTAPCDGAVELARDVDLLVCESTFLSEHATLARDYRHMTARQAGELATAAGARRLVLAHFSARYPDNDVFGREAGRYHGDVHVAEDLGTIDVPPRT
jgi:ribonuclease Z